ncbi:MAG TPA: histidine--tRNA ligase [Candidatus Acidoferrum sp.]|jgi:histidyl-tRNA synthetase
MTEKRQFRAIKGTRDILPPDSARWNWFEHTAREVFESYNFDEIRLPIFEETSLFARSIGEETDVVAKEMFSFSVYDAAGLLVLRDPIIRWPRPWAKAEHFEAYKSIVTQFIADYKVARSRGLVTVNSFNEMAFNNLETHNEELQAAAFTHAENFIRRVQADAEVLDLGQDVTLRPEATASVCRAYIEHNMQALPGNQKLYYIGPMFRRERPQKGRYRQFYQIGAEVLGQSDAPAIDAEVLEMLLVFFNRVGLTRMTLYVNSIGDKNCRPQYVELLREELRKVKDSLKEDSQRRIETNPLRVLDSKIPEEQPIIEKLPRISDHLCDDCRAHFAKLKEELNLRGIEYKEDWRLVRGLDYYTRTTFEVTAEGLGSQNAVCGGGRYDGLVELLGGPPTKGIGFAIGTDRSILSIEESGNAPKLGGLSVYIAWMGQASYPAAVNIARKLRAARLSVELPPEEMKFKKSLGLADKLGARYALIIGEDEVASHTFTLKRLADGDQKKLAEGELLEYLESERRR